MTIAAAVRRHFAAVICVLAVCEEGYALTIYDVIQISNKDYSDQDIVALIEVTESAFALTTQDIPRLMEAGVSETVVRSMLQARHAEKGTASPGDPASPVLAGAVTRHHENDKNETIRPHANAPIDGTSIKAAARMGFKAEPFEEAVAGDHHHRIITLADMQLFVLRDEGHYASIAARGNAVVSHLEEAASIGSGTFDPVHLAGKDAVMFSGRDTARAVVVVAVSADDADTYRRRSGRPVTSKLLAAYWSMLLSDYWSIIIDGEPPAGLTDIHEGGALLALYERVVASGEGTRTDPDSIRQALPRDEREHLLRLATAVPLDFDGHDPPIAGHP